VPRRAISIAAAPGWKARLVDEKEPEGARIVTLVAWALVEGAGKETEIVGVVQRSPTAESPRGRLAFADEVEGFDGYVFTGLATRAPDPDMPS
jgi:hypothetical protein